MTGEEQTSDGEVKEPPFHFWPGDGEHLWGKWYPNNRTSIRRSCVHPECSEVEVKDVY